MAAWIVLAAGIVLSVAAWLWVRADVERDARAKFRSASTALAARAQSRMNSYADLLYGVQGLFQAAPALSRRAFDNYVYSLNLPLRFPGVRAVSYAERVPAAERATFERRLRLDPELVRRGVRDVVIYPPAERSAYFVLRYIEPLHANKRALGFDLASDPDRMAMVERARDTGMPTLSAGVILAAEPAQSGSAVVMRLALYRKNAFTPDVERRREAFVGMANVTFMVEEWAQPLLSGEGYEGLAMSVYDAGYVEADPKPAPRALYSSSAMAKPEAGEVLEESHFIDAGQRRWILKYSAPREQFLQASDKVQPWVALAAVLAVSILLSGLIRSLGGSRERAIALAERMTVDLRASQARLAEEQRRAQELIEALTVPIYFKGTDGRYLGVNKAWETYFGRSRQDFVGKTVHELYPNDPEVAQRLHADDQAVWDHPGSHSYETVIRVADGTLRNAIYYKAALSGADGRVAGLIGTIVDITERKRAEAMHAQLAAIVENSGDAILSRDLDHRILTWNAAAARLFGYSANEVVGRPTLLLVPPECRAQAELDRESLDDPHAIPAYDAIRLAKDGRRVDVSVMQSAIYDSNGRLSGMSVAYRDITGRKQAEKRQKMEHAVTRVLAETGTLRDAIPAIIRTICETLGWACGAHWRWLEKAEELRCAETWHIDAADVAEFVSTASNTVNEAPAWRTGAPKIKTGGLVRRVWMDGAPVWFPDVTREPGFRRGPIAAKAGLHSAFGFPIMAGARPLGVMEFYSRDIAEPDDDLLQVVGAIGSQIGQFVERKQIEGQVQHLATHDSLTALPNRAMFGQLLNLAIRNARRQQRSVAVLFIDLDRFKIVNDTRGHEAGDQLLQEIAARFAGCLRESDVVARLGGDEFVVLLHEVGAAEQVAIVARKILAAAIRPIVLLGEECRVTASIGISRYPADAQDEQSLLKHADTAMYLAKEQGKNNFQFYSEQIQTQSLERVNLETALRHALERNELFLQYQAKLDLRTQAITGVEALLRWQHRDLGVVAPMRFLPIAEETGLILPIGRWVFKTACAQNVAWQRDGLPHVCVAVNLTARQFADDDLLHDIAAALELSGMRPELLELEITEGMVMQNHERTIKVLSAVKQMGVRIAISDFGVGYSSLAQIKRYSIDTIKVDRSFTRDLTENADNQAITKAIISIGQSLSLTVVAEGVERAEQQAFLREHACDAMQGFFFSRPVDHDEFASFMRQHLVPTMVER